MKTFLILLISIALVVNIIESKTTHHRHRSHRSKSKNVSEAPSTTIEPTKAMTTTENVPTKEFLSRNFIEVFERSSFGKNWKPNRALCYDQAFPWIFIACDSVNVHLRRSFDLVDTNNGTDGVKNGLNQTDLVRGGKNITLNDTEGFKNEGNFSKKDIPVEHRALGSHNEVESSEKVLPETVLSEDHLEPRGANLETGELQEMNTDVAMRSLPEAIEKEENADDILKALLENLANRDQWTGGPLCPDLKNPPFYYICSTDEDKRHDK